MRSSKKRPAKAESLDLKAIFEELEREMPPVKRRSSKRKGPSFAEWKASLVAIRKEVGFDLRNPVGFSEYLLALYGKDPVFHTDDPYHPILNPSFHLEMASGTHAARYASVFRAWHEAIAPHGMICARGLHSLGFLPGDDIPAMVYAGRAMHGRDSEEWGTGTPSDFSSYSMNLPIAVNWFASNNGRVGKSRLFVTPSLARAAAAADPRALDTVGVSTEKVAPAVRQAILASECPVVIVVSGRPADMHGWGGDSESGDTMEAEIHVKHCEPRCVQRFFVASALHKLGKPVRADERRYFALDEHMVVTGRKIGFYDAPKLILHPDAPAKGKIVKNLPADWTWYEVAVKS